MPAITIRRPSKAYPKTFRNSNPNKWFPTDPKMQLA
jgi:hypothetical protein